MQSIMQSNVHNEESRHTSPTNQNAGSAANTTPPFGVLLVDDHTLVRAGLRALVEDIEGCRVVGESSDGDQLEQLVARLAPDLVIMDIAMKQVSGLQALKDLKRGHPELPVIMLSMYASRDYVIRALEYGASGYLPKESAKVELELAIQSIRAGNTYLSPTLSDEIVNVVLHRSGDAPESPLTARQTQILALVARGQANKEIAGTLGVSVKTVEAHRAQIMDRLNIRDVAGLVIYAIKNGVISLDDV